MTLAVRTPNWIGDCVMARPALRLLESHYAAHDLILITRPYLVELFTPPLVSHDLSHPVIGLPLSRGWREVVSGSRRLKDCNAERGLLFTNSMSSALMFRLAGIRHLTGYRRDGRDLFLSKKLDWPRQEWRQVDAYNDLAAAELGTHGDHGVDPDWPVPEPFRDQVRRRLVHLGAREEAPWIGISPCTAHGSAKEWPHARFLQLIQILTAEYSRLSVLLFGSPADHDRLEALAATAPGCSINLGRNLSLAESVAAASLCRLFITNDSGMMHVADAVHTPVVALFGPTDPRRVVSNSRSVRVIHHHASCAPCKRRDCKDHHCMRSISVREVWEAVTSRLDEAEGWE
ncbi:MAG TPA: lipopolysaccharide heptosyltransferase II [Candidatus Aminicenantes bacterium]|nr:lipopolysaccharide heptosyltransferase II [Candidatus Aminicenantes bacterium]